MEFREIVPHGKLFSDVEKLNRWRNWPTGLKSVVCGAEIIGALDDLHESDVGLFSPLDYKTRGSVPRHDGSIYYGHQIDLYALQLRKNGMPVSGKGYLVYYWPLMASGLIMNFASAVFELDAIPERAEELIKKAMDCISGPMPSAGDCEYCSFIDSREAV